MGALGHDTAYMSLVLRPMPPLICFLSGCEFARMNDSSGTICTLLTSMYSV